MLKVAELYGENARAAKHSKKGCGLLHMVVHLVYHTTPGGGLAVHIAVYGMIPLKLCWVLSAQLYGL